MNAAARGGGASIRPTLSTTWLSRSRALEARRLDAHIHGKLGSTLSPLTKKHIPKRPCCSLELNRRSGATVPSRKSELVRSSSFAKKNNEEESDWYHASKYWLFATFARLFSSPPRASSRCLPSFALRRRVGLRRRSFRTPGCRSGVDLDDLGAKKDYEEMLAKKVEAWHRRRSRLVGPQTEYASQLSRAKMCAGWAPHWLHSSLPDGSISGLLRKRATANPFTRASCYSWSSNGHTSTTVWQKIRIVPHFLPLEDFSWTNGNRLIGAPRAHFRQKLNIDK